MCSKRALQLIMKWAYMGKRIIAYGDLNQLLPFGENSQICNETFINHIFSKRDNLNVNRRNNFDISFYDALIDGKCDNIQAIKNFRNIDSNNIICYTNANCKKYNEIVANRLNIKDKFSVGAKVICNTNELRENNIYNQMSFTIIEENENNVKLNNNVIITKKDMDKIDRINKKVYFSLGYARTIYGFQGSSLDNFYYPDDDFKFLDNRTTYTIISRLKGNFKKMKGIKIL